LTVGELEQRWQMALNQTRAAVARHPGAYHELKTLALDIIATPLDIEDYPPAVKKLAELLERLDPGGQGSIFFYFNHRIAPSSICDVPWLRMECRDLLAHLKAFDQWRIQCCRLRLVE
jgi:hypothetical protein